MMKYLPFIVVGIVMVPLTIQQWILMDWVWGDNMPSLQCAYLMEKEIPRKFGDWESTEVEVDEKILETAGADGYIDRLYTNTQTGEKVGVWLIVGHFRHIVRHTPNICYEAHGAESVGETQRLPIVSADEKESIFYTAKFADPSGYQERVFWGWWLPQPLEEGGSVDDVKVTWSAPENPRVDFGGQRALYKLYFKAPAGEDETAAESTCIKFAEEFLPLAEEVLKKSCLVLENEELPADAEQVIKRLRVKAQKESGGSTPSEQDSGEQQDARSEEEVEAAAE